MIEETYADRPLRFSLPRLNARGRAVRLDQTLADILAAHAYPPAIERLVAEALVLAALLGLLLKDRAGQLTLQAQTDEGAVELLVCDYREGELRGYARFDADRLAMLPPEPTLFSLFGRGYLAITFDQPGIGGEQARYQGIVALEGASLADATEYYFVQSEQVPTLIRVGIDQGNGRIRAGGLLVQHLAEGEEGRERLHVRLDHPDWATVRALAATVATGELTDPALSLDSLIWRLFSEEGEIRAEAGDPIVRGCRCSETHIRSVIGRFSAADRVAMAVDGTIGVDCEFCARRFPLSLASFTN